MTYLISASISCKILTSFAMEQRKISFNVYRHNPPMIKVGVYCHFDICLNETNLCSLSLYAWLYVAWSANMFSFYMYGLVKKRLLGLHHLHIGLLLLIWDWFELCSHYQIHIFRFDMYGLDKKLYLLNIMPHFTIMGQVFVIKVNNLHYNSIITADGHY